ncbi:MAG: alpha/beta fold hydrolase [Bacteroidota bacterium]
MKKMITLLLLTFLTLAGKTNNTNSDTACVSEPVVKDSVNLFLLRGLTRESGHWGPQFINEIKKQIPQARIYMLDLPGSGKYVNEKASFNISDMVEFMRNDVKSIIEKKNGDNIICATSLGGMLACEWVLNYKNDFQGMVIINSSFKKICKLNERVQWGVRKDMLKVMLAKTTEEREKLLVKINSNHPENYDSVACEWIDIQNERKMSKINIFKQTVAGMRYSTKGKKPEVPLLIIGSKGDRMVCTECVEKTQDAFGGTLVWHPDAGHGLPIDDPKWLSEQIADWYTTIYPEEILARN